MKSIQLFALLFYGEGDWPTKFQIGTPRPEINVLASLGPLILAEIGNVRRFHSGKALNAYAGNDAPPYQSGNFERHNRHISKRGNVALRKYCFEVMQALKLIKPQDDPVYLFLLKKNRKGNISTLPKWLP